MLDDVNVLKQRDHDNALGVAATLYRQLSYDVQLRDTANDDRPLRSIVIVGMGGSALAADMIKVLLGESIEIPLEVVKGYAIPHYVNENTLVVASSHSGNTEETLSCLVQARERGAQLAITSAGGKLEEIARDQGIMYAPMPHDAQPRMSVFYNMRAILRILVEYRLIDDGLYREMAESSDWLHEQSERWEKDTMIEHNYAKQLALIAVGKTPVFYAGSLMAPVAYKWKISWNENAKNVAFWNFLPEFNHNEFLGWTSHPIEKPFAIFDLVSDLENSRILRRFELSDQLLSGRRPKATRIDLVGDTLLKQVLWAATLADFVSIYVAILNNVDPTQVDLIERFKKELG